MHPGAGKSMHLSILESCGSSGENSQFEASLRMSLDGQICVCVCRLFLLDGFFKPVAEEQKRNKNKIPIPQDCSQDTPPGPRGSPGGSCGGILRGIPPRTPGGIFTQSNKNETAPNCFFRF